MASLKFKFYAPKNKAESPTSEASTPLPQAPHENTSIRGSFAYDRVNGYTLYWKSLDEANAWRAQEEKSKTIELVLKDTRRAAPHLAHLWSEKRIFYCSRGHTGGASHYVKKHNYNRKVLSKSTGCKCHLTLKLYPHTGEVLGRYMDDHNHDIGDANVRFTRLRAETRTEIERLLRLGVEPQKVLEQVQGKVPSENCALGTQSQRHHFCTRADVRRVERTIEEETIRLAAQDGASVLNWSETAAAMGAPVKSKRKIYTDSYAVGEQSGKKAKKDAKKAIPAPTPTQNDPLASSTPVLGSNLASGNPPVPTRSLQVFFTTASPAGNTSKPVFDPSTINLSTSTVEYLKGLGREKLYQLCNFHKISMSRTFLETATRLKALSTQS